MIDTRLFTNDISLKIRYSDKKKGGGYILYESDIHSCDLIGIYGEFAEIVGIENAIKIYENFKGQQVSFPMRLYTKDYVISQVSIQGKETIKAQATRYGYSERRLRQMLKENNDTNLV